ncbi:MAG: hypothetical protein M3Y84_08880 [Acidobacteriota bacterium]|nr:hypothetical protein [Acidobacteriota bacterium]
MFSFERRRIRKRHEEIAKQVCVIQRYLIDKLRLSLGTTHGEIAGAQLSQAMVDRLFARPVTLAGRERLLADRLSGDLVRENRCVRDATFVSLQALLEVESTKHNVIAKRRVLETLDWLRQFGEAPSEGSLAKVFEQLTIVGVDGLSETGEKANAEACEPRGSEVAPSDSKESPGPVDRLAGETWQIT